MSAVPLVRAEVANGFYAVFLKNTSTKVTRDHSKDFFKKTLGGRHASGWWSIWNGRGVLSTEILLGRGVTEVKFDFRNFEDRIPT